MPQLSGIILVGSYLRPVADGCALRLYGSASGHVGLAPAANAGSTTFVLPAADGSAGEVLATDGNGALGWIAPGVTDHGALIGLADDDHPQYVRHAILTANGDLLFRSAGQTDRLPIGTAGQALVVAGGLPVWSTLNTSQVDEGSHLYYTDARAQAAVTGAASSVVTSNLTANRAVVADSGGKLSAASVTATELGHLSGVTSAIQSQLNGKQATISILPINKGGTGVSTTPADGQLLVGSGSGFTLATISAGSNVTITNGPGSITIAASASGAIPGGADQTVQFNDSGDFAGSSGLTWNDSTGVLSVHHTISTSDDEIVLEETGDSFGTVRFSLRNRNGFNGMYVQNAGMEICDLLLEPASGNPVALRHEKRTAYIHDQTNNIKELQVLHDPTTTTAQLVIGDGSIIVGTPSLKLSFFGVTPIGQPLKANHNDWTNLSDVVQALVELGLLDQA